MSEHLDLSDPAIGELIRCKAAKLAKLARTRASTVCEPDDFAQDLWVLLLRQWKKFDPSRGDPGAFLHVVLKNAVANILRDLLAEKRSRPGQGESPVGCVDQRLAESDDMRDLVMDVKDASGRLPECLRVVADRLAASNTVAESADALGASRDTVYARIGAIRSRFERRGLEQYLKK